MERRTLLKAGLLTPAALALPAAEGLMTPAEAAPRVTKVLARGLRVPWGIAFLPNGSALVSERDTGRVLHVHKTGGYTSAGHVAGVVSTVNQGGEGGLLGLALHPRFTSNHWLYAYLSTASDNRVVRMTYADGKIGPPHVILKGIPTALHHNGGGLLFAPDGRLFVSTGDALNPARAQDKGSRSGKILRINDDGSVPAGNPFGNRVWTYGHRNVEGMAFGTKGRLWATEFGDHRWDELNLIQRGSNYGWPRVEGKDGPGGYHDPLVQWHPENCSPSGIAIVGGTAWIGSLRGESLWSVRLSGAHKGRKVRHFSHRYGRLRGVHRAPDGSLWITTSDRDGRGTLHAHDDHLFRVVVP